MKTIFACIACATVMVLPTGSALAGDFLKCEQRNDPQRSSISVEVGDLMPGAMYSATVMSGGNSAVASVAANPGGDAKYDFDSNMNDVMAGATQIGSNFINGSVSATVTDAMGTVVASGTAGCKVK